LYQRHEVSSSEAIAIVAKCRSSQLLVLKLQTNWEKLLPHVEFHLNDSISETTGRTPFTLLYSCNINTGFSGMPLEFQPAEDFI
jgi:hypothetical protein